MEATIPHIELDCILIDSATQVRGFKSGGDEPRGMYAVVGCNECAAMWLLMDPQTSDSARCPPLREDASDDETQAVLRVGGPRGGPRGRAALLAKKRDERGVRRTRPRLGARARRRRVGNRRPRVPRSVGDRRRRRRRGGRPREGGESDSRSRSEIVRDAVATVDEPTEENVVAHASDHGVPPPRRPEILTRLARRGELSESGGRYRAL